MNKDDLKEVWRRANKKYRSTEKGKLTAKRAEEKRKESRKVVRKQFLSTFKGRSYVLFNGARTRAKKKGLDFTITLEWVRAHLEKLECEVTGIRLELVTSETYGMQNNMQPFSPCVDRIDSKKGYTPDNCRIVCCIFNMCKFHWTDEDVKRFVSAYYIKEIQN